MSMYTTLFNEPVILAGFFIFAVATQSAFANHAKEIELKFSDAQFFISPAKNISQARFTTTYSVLDPGMVGQLINGIMQIFADNGTLVKTTSIHNGFRADQNGFQQFVTSMPTTSIKKINAVVLFTDLNKTSLLSNTINRNLSLNATE